MQDASVGSPRGSSLSLVIPAYNEEGGIGAVLEEAKSTLDNLEIGYEIIVVDDCSTDATAAIAADAGASVIRNVQNGGYGYSLMSGIRKARFPTIAMLDADGSYPVSELPRLLDEYRRGVAMVVGQRQGTYYTTSLRMRLLRWIFRRLAEFIVGRSVPDVNSGMRVFDKAAVLPLFPHMSNGFSFTTSITLLFIMQALPVSYIPVPYRKRKGSSKVHYFHDALRALQIVAGITARLNPVKLFLLGAALNVVVMAPFLILFYFMGHFAIPAAIVLQCSVLLTGLGLVSEALIDKTPFARGSSEAQPRDSQETTP